MKWRGRRREFGAPAQAKEECRDTQPLESLREVFRDTVFARVYGVASEELDAEEFFRRGPEFVNRAPQGGQGAAQVLVIGTVLEQGTGIDAVDAGDQRTQAAVPGNIQVVGREEGLSVKIRD